MTVAARLGHTQLTIVNRYVHALEDADKAAAATFGNLRRKEPVQFLTEGERV